MNSNRGWIEASAARAAGRWLRSAVLVSVLHAGSGRAAIAEEWTLPASKASAAKIEGAYTVEGGAGEEVRVNRITGDFFQVTSSEGWEGVGILDSTMYRGVFRDRMSPGAPEGAMGEQTIDFSDPENPKMKATYTVRRSGQFGQRWHRSASGTLGEKPTPDRPGPDDYVYIDVLPEAVTKVPPQYPDDARKARIEGTVMVQALVLKDGTVGECRVVKSVPGLDDAAAASVRQWRFKPALSEGKPAAVWVAVPVTFTLH